MTKDQFLRNSGCVQGEVESLLPFLFLGHIGDIGGYSRRARANSPGRAGHFLLCRPVGSGASPLCGVIMPLDRCQDRNLKGALTEIADDMRRSEFRKHDDGSQFYQAERQALLERVRATVARWGVCEIDIDKARAFFSLFLPSMTKELFKRLRGMEVVTAIRDEPGKRIEILETKPFWWRCYGEFMEWAHGPRLKTHNWWSHGFCELFADGIGLWSCDSPHPAVVRRSRFDLSQFLTVRPDVPVSDARVSFSMGQWGWAYLKFTLDDRELTIRLSNAFDPFEGLLSWVKMLAKGDIPASIEIEEEGPNKTLSLHYVGHPRNVLFLVQDPYDEDHVHLGGIVDHKSFVESFRTALSRFFEHDYDPEHWEDRPSRDGSGLRDSMLGDRWLTTGEWEEGPDAERQ